MDHSIKVAFRSVEFSFYSYIYVNFRLFTLYWSYPVLWLLTLFLVDFAYYWFHRFSHVALLFWSWHQIHHSSDYLNLTTAMRHGPLERYFSMVISSPAALLIPPNIFLMHTVLSSLYQIWVHTEVIRHLWILEHVLVTPSHHRVHHGRNPYCINVNYGGVLIIWDKMFGTFEPERPDEPPVYNVVDRVETYDHLWCQTRDIKYCLWEKPRKLKNWKDKIQQLFRTPSWFPGLNFVKYSDLAEKIENPVSILHVKIPKWQHIYVGSHMLICYIGYFNLTTNAKQLPTCSILSFICLMGCSLQCLSYILDRRDLAKYLEASRCLFAILFPRLRTDGFFAESQAYGNFISAVFAVSAGIWLHKSVSEFFK